MFQSFGLDFVPNNYAAPLSTENVPEAFHLFQNFLVQSDIGQALVEPIRLSGTQIKAFWETGIYDDGGESGNPSIIFEFADQEYVVTPTTVRDALGCEDFNAFTISVGDSDLQRMMREIGYSGPLARTGNLKRPFLRKKWSFFFDCITRAFGKKCTNWDVIPIDSLQIGYSLLYGTHFDFSRLVLNNIGEKMIENRNVVYFARFCQSIFSFCVDGVEIAEEDVIPSFKLHKRIFSDLTNKDVKKGNVGDLMLPASVQQFLNPQPQSQAQPESDQPLNSEPLPSTSQKPKTGVSVGTSRRKKRANRPVSDANVPSDEAEYANAKKRKLVAAYLFGGLVPDSTNVEAPEVVIEDHSANADDNAAVNDDFLEPILEMDIEEEIEAHPSATLEEFGSLNETEDVAADQPTLIIDESLATHTEILSVNHQVLEKGDEVDQTARAVTAENIAEEAAANIDEETAENNLEETAETIIQDADPEAAVEPIVEAIHIAEEHIEEAAQTINEATAENIVEEAAEPIAENVDEDRVVSDSDDHTSVNSDHANSGINIALSDSDDHDSLPFLRDPTAESVKENQHATEAHFREMYFANWSGADCIFPANRAADFVAKSAESITNPELLSHLKATIVQVKSLNNRFDDTHKLVTGLRNDIVARE
ncbi:hypothetical protein POM88_018855 [Heracleum sosnowskyi]|uniref:Uncharacterized protein n=1 Tax=Heracleum sosnowskyi TaxID=360622 RepID=A0AAD8MZR7_9APIA|nr:hypothetical protein POM88_018855 [Heracleum sosnowskyi]